MKTIFSSTKKFKSQITLKKFSRNAQIFTKETEKFDSKNFLKTKEDIQTFSKICYDFRDKKVSAEQLKKRINDTGIDVNAIDYDSRTLLHLAVGEGRSEIVKFLVEEKGAFVNCYDRFHNTPTHEGMRGRHEELVTYLVGRGGKTLQRSDKLFGSFIYYIVKENMQMIKLYLLVTRGALYTSTDFDNRSPLHQAAIQGSMEIVKLFVESKEVNINAVDNFGNTPITDAMKGGHQEIVDYLLGEGALMPSKVDKITSLPEFLLSIRKSLPLLCKRGFSYVEVYVPKKGQEVLVRSKDYHIKDCCLPDDQMNGIRDKITKARAQSKITYKKGDGVAGSVWEQQNIIYISDFGNLTEEEEEYLQYNKQHLSFLTESLNCNSLLSIPITYEGEVLAVIHLYKSNSDPEIKNKKMSLVEIQNLGAFANQLVLVGVPNLDNSSKSKKFHQMDEVLRILSNQASFDITSIYYEVDKFYNTLKMPKDYFVHFKPKDIAVHINSFISAKNVAGQSGGKLSYVSESNGGAYYITSTQNSRTLEMERTIEKYLKSTPEGYGYSLEYYQSGESYSHTSEHKLAIYTVNRYKQKKIGSQAGLEAIGELSEPHNIRDIAGDDFFYKKKKDTVEKYADILKKAHRTLNPVFEQYKEGKNTSLLFAFQDSTNESYLDELTTIVQGIGAVAVMEKFIYSFANGIVVYSLIADTTNKKSIEEILNKASLLSIIPSEHELTGLFTHKKFSARQLMYAISASKFCYYFTSNLSDEFKLLADHLKNDHVNTGRLFTLQKKLKQDSLTEQRIIDCILSNQAIVREIFIDFAQICGKEKKVAYNKELDAKISKTVPEELDISILKSFLVFNSCIRKTNFYKLEKSGISFRLSPNFLQNTNYPEVPYAVFLVVSNSFIGFHVRFRDVARGGIRVIKSRDVNVYHNNVEGLFNECYGLAYTQQKKNKDIPEGGSKGVILLFPDAQNTIQSSFKKYVDSLLDILLSSKDIFNADPDHPEILFLGPDENTANVMDWAALHAKSRGYPFWKAFTTGKSTQIGGIPHDVYGMTTASVHENSLGIIRRLKLNEEVVTKIQTGGPDGDLGSNEIMVSKDKTIGIVDGSGVLYDPAGLDRKQLLKLANEKKTITDFPTEAIGNGGFKVLVDDNDITLPNGDIIESGFHFRNTFHISDYFTADLFVPCGGRPESINISNVSKLFNEDGTPKIKYIVEGANLFLTQDARLVLEEAGVILYKDASANKGGVTSSSLEVLAALSFTNEEFKEHMQVKESGEIPQFYNQYVQEVISKIKNNARMEFECVWDASERTKKPKCTMTDEISLKINQINENIKESTLWKDKVLVNKVMKEALPQTLIKKLGLEVILKRVPDNYLNAIFGAHLASTYIYRNGMDATEFDFFNFMQEYTK